jgi:hypothetical protein
MQFGNYGFRGGNMPMGGFGGGGGGSLAGFALGAMAGFGLASEMGQMSQMGQMGGCMPPCGMQQMDPSMQAQQMQQMQQMMMQMMEMMQTMMQGQGQGQGGQSPYGQMNPYGNQGGSGAGMGNMNYGGQNYPMQGVGPNFGQQNGAGNNYSGGSPGAPSSADGASSTGETGPVGDVQSPTDFAKAVLKQLGAPETDANIKSLVKWEQREGGNWHNSAHFNPLCTTQKEQGATNMNSCGVKAYTSWDQGVQATVSTLQNGQYGDIISGLKSGNGLSQGNHQGLSKWSGGAYSSI